MRKEKNRIITTIEAAIETRETIIVRRRRTSAPIGGEISGVEIKHDGENRLDNPRPNQRKQNGND